MTFPCAPCFGTPVPTAPFSGCTVAVCDNAYLLLGNAPRGRVLIVPPNSNCQLYLTPATGFMVDDGSGMGSFLTNSPAIDMPILNAVTGETIGLPGAFRRIAVSPGGSENSAWKHLLAPTVGSYRLETDSGEWKLVDASGIPGIAEVMTQVGSSSPITMIGAFDTGEVDDDTGDPIYVLRKLNSPQDQPIVGVTRGDGTTATRALPLDEPLKHPLATFTTLKFKTLTAVDDDGDPIPSGYNLLPADTATTANSIPLWYNVATGKFYRAPAAGYNRKFTAGESANIPDNDTYMSLPDARLTVGVTLAYGKALVTFATGIKDVAGEGGTNLNAQFKLKVDGVDWVQFASGNSKSQSGTDIVTGLTPGSHTFEIVAKNIDTGTGALLLRSSLIAVQELPY